MKALEPGARIAVISPAGKPKMARVELGMERLRGMGFVPVPGRSATAQGPLYYAGDAAARAADLHEAFANPDIAAVLCTRGGWGSAELLPLLDADLIRSNPKPFLGFSDVTTLHVWMQQECGLKTFYAPMLSPDFARETGLEAGVDLRSFRAALQSNEPWSVGTGDGLRMLRASVGSDQVEGVLFGGCLSLLAESLGTPYAVTAPNGDSILFLEDVGTHPYQWDRMLVHLRLAGVLDRVKAIVFGDMEQCLHEAERMDLLEAALLHSLRDFRGPIAIGLRSGHVNTPNVTLPLGVRVRLDSGAAEPVLHVLESAVE